MNAIIDLPLLSHHYLATLSHLLPFLNQGPGRDFARVNLPLVDLEVWVVQHFLKHRLVHGHGRARQVGHEVQIELVARVLEQAGRAHLCNRKRRGVE